MSYTPPAGNAADFDWQGEAAYTAPGGAAADFDFVTGNIVTGFTSTAVGSPTASAQFTGDAAGFVPTAFGDPVRGGIQIEVASSVPGGTPTLTATPATIFSDGFGSPLGSLEPTRPMGFGPDPLRVWGYIGGNPQIQAWGGLWADSGVLGTYDLPRLNDVFRADFQLRRYSSIYAPENFVRLQLWWYSSGWDEYTEIDLAIRINQGTANISFGSEGNWVSTGSVVAPGVSDPALGELFAVSLELDATHARIFFGGAQVLAVAKPAFWAGSQNRPSLEHVDLELRLQGLGVDEMEMTGALASIAYLPGPTSVAGQPSVALTQPASGFQTGSLGEHASLVSFGASGIAPATTVSTPLALFSMIAAGFSSTAFGDATASTTFAGQASTVGASTQLGGPTVAAICTASPIEPTTQVPRAYFAFNQWLFGSGADPSTIFGLGYGINVPAPPLEHRTVAAADFRQTTFGQAQAQTTAQGAATGFAQANYGAPTVRISHSANGFATGAVGDPLSAMLGRASGFRSTVIPAPYGAPARAAAAIAPTTRFGMPKAIRPNVYPAYGFGTTRLGQPSGTQFFGHQVDGWVAAVLGTPLGYSALKARPSGPAAKVGRPTLRRTPLC